jgi:hypothetical protein
MADVLNEEMYVKKNTCRRLLREDVGCKAEYDRMLAVLLPKPMPDVPIEENIVAYLQNFTTHVAMKEKFGTPSCPDHLQWAIADVLNEEKHFKKSTCRRLLLEDMGCKAEYNRFLAALLPPEENTRMQNKRPTTITENENKRRVVKGEGDFSMVPPPPEFTDEKVVDVDAVMDKIHSKFQHCSLMQIVDGHAEDEDNMWEGLRKKWAATEKGGYGMQVGGVGSNMWSKSSGSVSFVQASEP